MGEPRVRRLVDADIERALELTDLESWGYTRADFERLLALSPDGCFAAEEAGRVVGVLSTTAYDGLAFLGAVIVSPEARGQGVGRVLMQAALLHLASMGVATVRLNAYRNVIPFYEKLGFRREYDVVRWRANVSPRRAGTVAKASRDDLEDLAAFDAPFFGAPRRALLARLLDETPSTFLVAREGPRILGYIVGSAYDDACEVGPWVAAPGRPDVARELFDGLVDVVGRREYALSGPATNPDLVGFVQEAGFTEVFRTLRMGWGKDLFPGDPRGLWAAAGLEKG